MHTASGQRLWRLGRGGTALSAGGGALAPLGHPAWQDRSRLLPRSTRKTLYGLDALQLIGLAVVKQAINMQLDGLASMFNDFIRGIPSRKAP